MPTHALIDTRRSRTAPAGPEVKVRVPRRWPTVSGNTYPGSGTPFREPLIAGVTLENITRERALRRCRGRISSPPLSEQEALRQLRHLVGSEVPLTLIIAIGD
jgi:hypothetical protein